MDGQGLAGIGPSTGQAPQAGNQDQTMALVQEVMKLLAQGIDPNELLKQGIPKEIIQMAIDQLNAQAQQPQPTDVVQPQQGLAAQGLR
jgi:hypothetical protein